jgi:virginiamycin A acetyltransferase
VIDRRAPPWWNWPIDVVTEHVRAIMTGTAAELERIAAERGLVAT